VTDNSESYAGPPVSGAEGDSGAADGKELPPALRNTERLLQHERSVEVLLALLDDSTMWIRFFTIQLLIALLSQRPAMAEEAVLQCPAGLSRLLTVLEDKREEVRNELLLLLLTLTRGNPLIQQFVAFQEGFERLFEIMREEVGVKWGGCWRVCLCVCGCCCALGAPLTLGEVRVVYSALMAASLNSTVFASSTTWCPTTH